MVIKLLASEAGCNSTPSTFGGSRLVRIVNKETSTVALITHKAGGGATIGTISILPQTELTIEKTATDTLESNNASNVLAVPVAYKN
jgi:hypothetical protein